MYEAIALVDASQGVLGWDDAHGQQVAAALSHQLHYHVAPAYRKQATPVVWCGKNAAPVGSWPIVALPKPDVQGALGYHDVDPNGLPYGRIFPSVCAQAHVTVESVFSHEVIEADVDPFANDWSDMGTSCVAHEASDPVQNSSYEINGIEVSNFVTRLWFDSQAKSGTFDYLKHLTHPLQVETGGYLILMKDGAVSQKFGDGLDPSTMSGQTAYRQQTSGLYAPSRSEWRSIRAAV